MREHQEKKVALVCMFDDVNRSELESACGNLLTHIPPEGGWRSPSYKYLDRVRDQS